MADETLTSTDTHTPRPYAHLLEKEFPVLDHGFVRLIDVMGSDAAIVQAARVSYGSGTKKVHEDRGLIRYLLRHKHTTPFEMVEFKFHIKLPIFIARQWIRHRTANVNEYSGRYSVMKEEFYLPESEMIRAQSKSNRQGRADEPIDPAMAESFRDFLGTTSSTQYAEYLRLIDQGVARELARIALPLSLYTEWYWKIDLHNLFHFLRLRLDPHAQYEIRAYAEVMGKLTKEVVPLAWEAFEDYILQAVSFTAPELRALASSLGNLSENSIAESGLSARERAELIMKLDEIKAIISRQS